MAANTYNPPSTAIVHHTGADLKNRDARFETVYLVQYDDTLPIIAVHLYAGGVAYSVPEGADVNIRLNKNDGHHVYNPALGVNQSRSIVYFGITQQMTTNEGNFSPVVEISAGGEVAGTGAFTICMDQNPIPSSAIRSTDEYLTLTELVRMANASAEAASASAATATNKATAAQQSATAAASSASTATQKAADAASSATAASTSANTATAKASAASNSAGAAKVSETNAKASELAAKEAEEHAVEIAGGTADAAQKLATPRLINGTAFDGTGDIRTQSSYNYKWDSLSSNCYNIFYKAVMQRSFIDATFLITVGAWGYAQKGIYFIHCGPIGATSIGVKLTEIAPPPSSAGRMEFGYYIEDGYLYVGIYASAYARIHITEIEAPGSSNAVIGTLHQTTDKPGGWTALPADLPGAMPNAGFHNSNCLGRNLGTAATDAQYAAMANGSFEGQYVGDYWLINNFHWRLACCCYYNKCGDTSFTKPHWLVVPDEPLYNAPMNNTATTTGGYVGSKMYIEGLEQAKEIIHAAFPGHVLSHKVLLTNGVTNGKPSSVAWKTSEVELMTEAMVYGGEICAAGPDGTDGVVNFKVEKSQLPLFAFRPDLIVPTSRANWWLRDVVSDTKFTCVGNYGFASTSAATGNLGVRPYFCIG